jgi:S1-C subfamily serine protease
VDLIDQNETLLSGKITEEGWGSMKQQNKSLWQLPTSIAGVLLFCALSNTSAQTVPQIAEKALAATVFLEMRDRKGAVLSSGSGFFIRPNLIATNYHVIEGAAQGTAKLVSRNKRYTIEGFTATDKTNDLALLQVTMRGVKPLPLDDSNAVLIGETVYVAGNPLGFEGTFSDGIISGRRDRHTKERLQMTAPISPGSSGGPVLNVKGKVIGVSAASHRRLDAQNLNFAIPSNYLKTLLEQTKSVRPLSQENQSISAETYFLRGNVNCESGLCWAAIANFNAALHLKPDFADAYYSRGFAKSQLGKYTAAIADYDTFIRLKPNEIDGYIGRGLARNMIGQYSLAIVDFDMAIRRKPNNPLAYYLRGLAKAKLKHYAEARQNLRTARKFAIRNGNNSLRADIEEALKIIGR